MVAINCSVEAVAKGQLILQIMCFENYYNLAHRHDDTLIEQLAQDGIAYVPFFPLGGFTPLQSTILQQEAETLQVSPLQVALAWLLQRSPNILLIPGTSSLVHLQENLAAAQLVLPEESINNLNRIASEA
ncbi:Pyridoxine 4-dehydrogenase [Vreelandella titanicae]|uniref:Pyridoxine 4-dehydrogenase n=2 Tax=Vreelandella titanicae TaxID=664683 RepID=A0AAP9NSS8_9GAMM|nr:aldo/keto reductase [Halomonas titanicae]QKS27248.1 Pyridoxine 4-dehydrogenase [Halomonas titanicae]